MTRTRRAPLLVVGALLLLPLAILAVRVGIGHQLAPDGDTSLITLRTRDVFSSHPPLVGSYERFGFNMPGPMLFAVLAVPYGLLGSRYGALQVGIVLWNALAVVAVLVVAWRRGRAPLLVWTAALLALLLHGLGATQLASPWEPNSVVLPMVALVALVWEVTQRSWWALVPAIIAASFLAEAYISAAPVALGVLVVGVGVAVLPPRHDAAGPPRRLAIAAAVVAVVVWLPVLVEQLFGAGNVGRIVAFARHGSQPIGARDGYRLVALEWDWWAPWAGRSVPLQTLRAVIDLRGAPVVPWALVAAVAGLAAAIVTRQRDGVALGAIVLVTAVLYVVAFARLTGPVFAWIGDPTRPIGMLCWWAAGRCAWVAWTSRFRSRSGSESERHGWAVRSLLGAIALVAVVATVAVVVDAVRTTPSTPALAAAVDRLAARAAPELRAAPGAGPTLVRSGVDQQLVFGAGDGLGREELVLALERRDVPTVVDADRSSEVRFGTHRAEPSRGRREVVLTLASALTPPGWQRVAAADPLTRAQRALRNQLSAWPRLTLTQLRDTARHDAKLAALLRKLRGVPDLPVLALQLRLAAP